MMFGAGVFRIGPCKFDQIVAVNQDVAQRDQAPFLMTGIKGQKRKRQDEVAAHDSSSKETEEQSKKKTKKAAAQEWETEESMRLSIDCSISKNDFVRDWLKSQSNVSYEIKAPNILPVFQKCERIPDPSESGKNNNQMSPLNSEKRSLLNSKLSNSFHTNPKGCIDYHFPILVASEKNARQSLSTINEAKPSENIVSHKYNCNQLSESIRQKPTSAPIARCSLKPQGLIGETATVSRLESLKVIFYKTDGGNWAVKNKSFESQAKQMESHKMVDKKTEVMRLKDDSVSKDSEAENEARKRFEVLERVKRALARDRSNRKEKKGPLRKTRFGRIRKQVSNLFEMKARTVSRNFRS